MTNIQLPFNKNPENMLTRIDSIFNKIFKLRHAMSRKTPFRATYERARG